MQLQVLTMSILTIAATACIHGEKTMSTQTKVKEATSINIEAAKGQEANLSHLLSSAAELVRKTEPETLQWMAIKENDKSFRIIDFFENDSGRSKHFGGQVAAALKNQSSDLVAGGWDKGVLANVQNSQVLAGFVRPLNSENAKLASYITLKAKQGQAENLASFLKAGADLVEQTEPKTLVWYALQLDNSTFAIYDVFASAEGRDDHFNGKVAAALKENAEKLVEGSREKGVLANIRHYDVLSSKL